MCRVSEGKYFNNNYSVLKKNTVVKKNITVIVTIFVKIVTILLYSRFVLNAK